MATIAPKSRTVARLAAGRVGEHSQVAWEPSGWLTLTSPHAVSQIEEPLGMHREWAGPVKLIGEGHECRERREVFLASSLADDDLFDDGAMEEIDGLVAELTENVLHRRPANELDGWQPPDARAVAAWLAEAG